jgi:hypothetical protein
LLLQLLLISAIIAWARKNPLSTKTLSTYNSQLVEAASCALFLLFYDNIVATSSRKLNPSPSCCVLRRRKPQLFNFPP